MELSPDSQSFDLAGPETRGVPFDELRSMSKQYPGLTPLIDSPLSTTKPSPVLLLTGAGASRPLGMPTMLEFKSNFANNLCNKEAFLWNGIVDLTAKFFGIDAKATDIEQVLTYIDHCEICYEESTFLWEKMYGMKYGTPTIEQVHEFRQDLWSLRSAVLDEICATYKDPERLKVVDCYDPLFRMLNSVSGQVATNVFTTNYDLTFEVLAKVKPDDFELVDGFVTLPSGEEVFKKQYVPAYNAEHSIILWKLHGSTSWKGQIPNLELRKECPGNYIQAGGERTIIIYPTRNKDASQNLHTNPFNQAYGGLASMFSQIQATQVLLVIGYRFGDTEIREVIEEGIATEGKATVVVVDPSATLEDVAGLFTRVEKERFRVIPHKFCEQGTIEKIGEEVRSAMTRG